MKRGTLGLLALGAALALLAGLGPVAWDLAHDPRPGVDAAPVASYDDERVQRRVGESTVAYVDRASRVVADAVVHSDEPDPAQTWAVAVLDALPGDFRTDYGVIHPSGLRQGLCSQHALVLAEILRRNGVPSADAYQVDGHVVVEYDHEGRTYVVDPDIGVDSFPVGWADSDALDATVAAVYASAPGPYDVEWARPIFRDTTGDAGEYVRANMQALADRQGSQLAAVEAGRWVLLAIGLCALVTAARRASVTPAG